MKRIVIEPQKDTVVDKPIDVIELVKPVQALNFSELKSIPKFKYSRTQSKRNILYRDFVSKVSQDLEDFVVGDNKYDHSLVLKVCDIAEMFFIDKGSGESKKNAVIASLLPYFNNDEILISKIIDFVYPMIHKSSLYRRNKKRLWNMTVSVFNFFLRKQ
jgi:hypothetical protein